MESGTIIKTMESGTSEGLYIQFIRLSAADTAAAPFRQNLMFYSNVLKLKFVKFVVVFSFENCF